MQHGFVRIGPVFIVNGQSPEVLVVNGQSPEVLEP